MRETARTNAFDKAVAAAIRREREQRGISQTELAQHLGVSYQQLHKYERCQNRMSVGRFAALCAALGLNPGDILAVAAAEAQANPHGARLLGQRLVLEIARTASDLPPRLQTALHNVAIAMRATDRRAAPDQEAA